MNRNSRARLVPAISLSIVTAAAGMFAMPTNAPVERLARNAAAYVSEHPDDAYGHYVLARIHSLAFTLESAELAVYREDADREGRALPQLASDDRQGAWARWSQRTAPPTRDELGAHLEEAVRNFERALALAPEEESAVVRDDWVNRKPGAALFQLGLAYLLETGSVIAGEVDVLPDGDGNDPDAETREEIVALIARLGSEAKRKGASDSLRARLAEASPILFEHRNHEDRQVRDAVRRLLSEYWRERAIAHYFVAWERTIEDDLKIDSQPSDGLEDLISYEAGCSYLSLVRARGIADEAERARVDAIAKSNAVQEAKPHYMIITPIIFSLDAPLALRELLRPDHPVCFDLDGDDRAESWPWVAPNTAILVWDPEREGEITSGRQLFGSVTWWLFPGDGYHALDLLDDNRDGELAGPELDGIALWFDRDSSGVSDPGEVIPAADAGIVALAAQALTEENGCPSNPWGVELADGRLLPTYDWIIAPANGTPEPAPPANRFARR